MDLLKKQGEKLKKQVQKTAKDFLDEHPDELAKVKNTASKVVNSSQKAIEKQAKKLDISTNFKHQLSTSTSGTTKTTNKTTKVPPVPAPTLVPAPAPTPVPVPAPTPTPAPIQVTEKVVEETTIEDDYVSVIGEKAKEEVEEEKEQKEEAATVQVQEEETEEEDEKEEVIDVVEKEDTQEQERKIQAEEAAQEEKEKEAERQEQEPEKVIDVVEKEEELQEEKETAQAQEEVIDEIEEIREQQEKEEVSDGVVEQEEKRQEQEEEILEQESEIQEEEAVQEEQEKEEDRQEQEQEEAIDVAEKEEEIQEEQEEPGQEEQEEETIQEPEQEEIIDGVEQEEEEEIQEEEKEQDEIEQEEEEEANTPTIPITMSTNEQEPMEGFALGFDGPTTEVADGVADVDDADAVTISTHQQEPTATTVAATAVTAAAATTAAVSDTADDATAVTENVTVKQPSQREFVYPTRLSATVAEVSKEFKKEAEEKNDDDDTAAAVVVADDGEDYGRGGEGNVADDVDADNKSSGSGSGSGAGSGSGSGSDSEDWEDSGDEACRWPTSKARYAPIGDATSRVSHKGSNRLAREFTMGAGFHHLNAAGNKVMHTKPMNTMLSSTEKLVHYNEAALQLMEKNKLKGKGLRMNKSTYLDKILLVTDAPHAIRVYIGDDDGPCIVGMALLRDDIIFTSGILSEDFQKPLTLQLDPESPVFENIELQSCTWLEGKDRVEKKISYLRLSSGGDALEFGTIHESGFDGKRSIYSEVESATGKLCLSGVGYFDNKPISLQVVDLGADCNDVVDAMDTCVYYNNGVISGNVVRSRAKEVEFLSSIVTEDDQVWDCLVGCMDAVENSSPSYGELLPNAVNLLERSLSGDVQTIHSVFRMDRHLTHAIQQQTSIDTFENDHLNFYSKLIPMKQMWGIFANTIERIKRINSYQPELNSFNMAFLQGTDEFKLQAVFVFLTQAALLILTLSHIWVHREDAFHIPSPLRFLVSISGTIVVNFMAKQSKNNFEDFATIFPEYVNTTQYKLDAFSNIVGGYLVTLSTLVILLMTDDNLDIVLNATALLFVLELDECLVDTNPIVVTSVYRAYFMKDILKELNQSDARYWNPDYLRKDRGQHYRLHLPSCSFLFPTAANDEK